MANSGIVGALKVLLGLDTAEFETGIKKVKGQAKSLEGDLAAFGKSFASSLLPVASVAGAGFALAALGKQAIESAGRIQDLSTKLGVSTDFIQKLDYVAGQTGSSLEAFSNATFKLGVNLENGTKLVDEAVSRLGLNLSDLQGMRPEEQFETIAKALSEMEDPQERNALALKLFGKTAAEVIPAIVEKYSELAKAAPKASKEHIAALDEMGDKWQELKGEVAVAAIDILGSLKGLSGQEVGGLMHDLLFGITPAVGELTKVASAFRSMADAGHQRFLDPKNPKDLEALDDISKKLTKTVKGGTESVDLFAASLSKLTGASALKDAAEALELLAAAGGPSGVLPSQLTALADTFTKAAEAARKFGNVKLAQQYELLAKTLSPIIQFQQRYNVTIGEYVTKAGMAERATEALWEQFYRLSGQVQTIGPVLENSFDINKFLVPFKKAALEVKPVFRGITDELKADLIGVVSDFPNLLIKAFTGGGGLKGAFKALGVQLGEILGKTITDVLEKTLQNQKIDWSKVGGSLALSGANLAIQLALNAKPDARDWVGVLHALQQVIDKYGSIAAAEKAMGVTRAELLRMTREQAQAIVTEALTHENAIADIKQQIIDLQGELGTANGQLDSLLSRASDLGYNFDREGNLVSVSFEKMKSVADKFGVSTEALGKSFQAARLAAGWKEVVDAITLLAKGGTDAGTILTGMKDEIGHLVSESIKFGTKIPENMRPWIQNLIDTGQLIDDNGQKITDISQINFGPEIKTEFDIVQGAIKDVIEAIRLLITKIDELIAKQIPDKSYTVTEKRAYEGEPDDGPRSDTMPVPAATGGLFSRATRVLLGEGGQPEIVGPVSFMAQALRGAIQSLGSGASGGFGGMTPALAGDGASGQVGTVNTYNTYNTYEISTLDGDSFENIVRNKITPQQRRDLSNNTGGVRTGFKNDLGI